MKFLRRFGLIAVIAMIVLLVIVGCDQSGRYPVRREGNKIFVSSTMSKVVYYSKIAIARAGYKVSAVDERNNVITTVPGSSPRLRKGGNPPKVVLSLSDRGQGEVEVKVEAVVESGTDVAASEAVAQQVVDDILRHLAYYARARK
ncbi:hypothetical protein ACFL56_02065 [Candidatus Margulisiibacteriota bacterium]